MVAEKTMGGRTIEELMALEYPCEFHKKDSTFLFLCRDLNVMGQGSSPESAYAALQDEKRRLFTRMVDSGFEIEPPAPSGQSIAPPAPDTGIGRFALKTLVASLIVLALLGIVAGGGLFAGYKVASKVPALAKSKVSALVMTLENMPDHEVERLTQRVRKVVHNMAPVIRELNSVLDSPTPPDITQPDTAPDES